MKKKSPALSPKRRAVVYKTNLTNRQQKELLSVWKQRYQVLFNLQNYFDKKLKRFLLKYFNNGTKILKIIKQTPRSYTQSVSNPCEP